MNAILTALTYLPVIIPAVALVVAVAYLWLTRGGSSTSRAHL